MIGGIRRADKGVDHGVFFMFLRVFEKQSPTNEQFLIVLWEIASWRLGATCNDEIRLLLHDPEAH